MLFFRFQFALRPGHVSGKVRGVFKTKLPCLARTKMGSDLLSTAVRSDSYSAAPPPLKVFFSNQRTNHFWPATSDKNHPEKPNPNAPPRTFQKRPGCFSDFQSIKKQVWKKATSNQQILPTWGWCGLLPCWLFGLALYSWWAKICWSWATRCQGFFSASERDIYWELEAEQKKGGEKDFLLGGSVSEFGLKPAINTPFGCTVSRSIPKRKPAK